MEPCSPKPVTGRKHTYTEWGSGGRAVIVVSVDRLVEGEEILLRRRPGGGGAGGQGEGLECHRC